LDKPAADAAAQLGLANPQLVDGQDWKQELRLAAGRVPSKQKGQ
jgi:hypothetical protein